MRSHRLLLYVWIGLISFLVAVKSSAQQPTFKLPLPGGKHWRLNVEVGTSTAQCPGGVGGKVWAGIEGGFDCFHAGRSQYSLDFADNNQEEGELTGVREVAILAAAGGTVADVVLNRGQQRDCRCFGNFVVIDHGNGFTTTYAHLKDDSIPATVFRGAAVQTGDVLGIMGTTGESTGIHLHFGVRFNGEGSSQAEVLDRTILDGRKIIDYKVGPDTGAAAYYFSTNLPHQINNLVSFSPLSSTFRTSADTSECPAGFVGKFSFSARLANRSSTPSLSDLIAEVTALTNGNLLQNADGGPSGAGAILTVSKVGGFSNAVLSPGEFVDVPFIICLKNRNRFTFFVDVLGVKLCTFSRVRWVSTDGSDSGDCTTHPCRTIQFAIDRAANCDTIKVSAGTYAEKLSITERSDLTIHGTNATNTIIQGNHTFSQVRVQSSTDIIIKEFTIRDGGHPNHSEGGAIQVFGGTRGAFLQNLILVGNEAANGGAIAVDEAGTQIINCLLFDNAATNGGGAMIVRRNSTAIMENTTVADNLGNFLAGGVINESKLTIRNSILWNNNLRQIDTFAGGTLGAVTSVSFSDIERGHPGFANIDRDPLFANSPNGNFSLRAGSPAIDAGTNQNALTFDLNRRSRPLDGNHDGIAIVDMGAFEFDPIE